MKLFETKKDIPKWIADYFYLANSGTYSGKQSFYSNVKTIILDKFGIFDGYDQQIIKKECWSCHGTGLYKHYWYECGELMCIKQEKCYSCIKGVYSTRQFFLKRYILNENIYHIPCDFEPIVGPIKNKINGIIKHETVNSEQAYRAYIILLFLYNKNKFYCLIKDMIQEEIRLKTNWIRPLIQKLFAYENTNTADTLPF